MKDQNIGKLKASRPLLLSLVVFVMITLVASAAVTTTLSNTLKTTVTIESYRLTLYQSNQAGSGYTTEPLDLTVQTGSYITMYGKLVNDGPLVNATIQMTVTNDDGISTGDFSAITISYAGLITINALDPGNGFCTVTQTDPNTLEITTITLPIPNGEYQIDVVLHFVVGAHGTYNIETKAVM